MPSARSERLNLKSKILAVPPCAADATPSEKLHTLTSKCTKHIVSMKACFLNTKPRFSKLRSRILEIQSRVFEKHPEHEND